MNKLGTNWQGIRYEWRYYRRSDCIAFVGMTVFYSLAGFYMNTLMRTMQQTEPAAGVLDYLFYFLNGSNLPLMQQKQQFEIPVTYIFAIFIPRYYFLGNAAMLQRMSLFTPSGSNYVQQIWIDCAVISIIFIMNMLIVKRKDFLSSKNA